jgi:hypothetical protein
VAQDLFYGRAVADQADDFRRALAAETKLVDFLVHTQHPSPLAKPDSPAKWESGFADANAFLNTVIDAKAEEFPAVGEGSDIRLSGRNITGAALVADDHIIHLSAFSVGN